MNLINKQMNGSECQLKTSWLIIRPFITEDSLTEEIKEYRI